MTRKGQFDFDCAVIGGGPGGLVSTIYLRRYRRSVALVQTGRPRASWIPRTHNLIGFDRGITGLALLKRLNRHVSKLGCERFEAEAAVRAVRGGFEVRAGGETFRVPNVVFATGITDLDPRVPGLAKLRAKGLMRYCPICDAYEHRERSVGALVADSAGARRALFMAHYTKNLTLFAPSESAIATRERKLIECTGAKLVIGDVRSFALTARNRVVVGLASGVEQRFDVLYSELGSTVNDDAFKNLGLKRNREGRLITGSEQRLSLPGAYGVGDCTESLSQLAIAAAGGAVAATDIHNQMRYRADDAQIERLERERSRRRSGTGIAKLHP